jgi:hypothetical protein
MRGKENIGIECDGPATEILPKSSIPIKSTHDTEGKMLAEQFRYCYPPVSVTGQ